MSSYVPMDDHESSLMDSSDSFYSPSNGHDNSSAGVTSAQAPTSTLSTRAKEVGSALSSNASKWFQSTKSWLREKTAQRDAPTYFQDGHHFDDFASEGEGQLEEEWGPQAVVPVVQGEIVSGEGISVRALYRTLKVTVPEGAEGNEFVVALPTGEARTVTLPRGFTPGDTFAVAYNGYIEDAFGIEFEDEREEEGREEVDEVGKENDQVVFHSHRRSAKPKRKSAEERLVEFYRKHNPEEREAVLQRGRDGFGLQVYDGEFGVHVHHAVFVGVQTMLAADDIIVSLNGEPVQNVQEFKQVISTVPVGDFLTIGLLRRSPPPVQRCPDGHSLHLVGPRDPLPIGSACNRCGGPLWNVIRVHRCDKCDWSLCHECYKSAFENMNTDRNANRGDPEWAQDYEEQFGAKLSFSSFDKGTKIRVYWHTTGEWWLGEVVSYHPERGHEIVYEEGSGDKKQFSKQTIPDISLHPYRVLKKKSVQDKVHASNNKEESVQNTEYTLTEDEKSLLEGIEADLGTSSTHSHSPSPADGNIL